MCHSAPAPPIHGRAASQEPLKLTAADGNTFLAHRAEPAVPNGRGVVILPDARGLHPFYREPAVRFAEAGFRAVAIDYFDRTSTEWAAACATASSTGCRGWRHLAALQTSRRPDRSAGLATRRPVGAAGTAPARPPRTVPRGSVPAIRAGTPQ
ncbi:dienelactone hydrolase family protein [Nonomuraea sp. NEAU-A123]|uniref:dienelactone hydrolase family protein n=1 Tax=Nonomuraea sp. NEAU-A123 TaxID=2839649 RepID=UPI001BE3D422|nr:dienelactone hydrolase family protein [Nonomuraea sp. NEAU-A123]MBT2235394.1 dienelactone hydrolase family protein [Nonomuraea sp. NEAU-A123]